MAAASAIPVGDFSFIHWVGSSLTSTRRGITLFFRLPIIGMTTSGSAVRNRDPPLRNYFQKKCYRVTPRPKPDSKWLAELLLDFGAAIEGRGPENGVGCSSVRWLLACAMLPRRSLVVAPASASQRLLASETRRHNQRPRARRGTSRAARAGYCRQQIDHVAIIGWSDRRHAPPR